MQYTPDQADPVLRDRMRSIRSKNTTPEIITRRALHALGFRFRLHRRDLPGSPDITLSRHRAVVLVHGCFWHQHHGCRLAKTPAVRPEYWVPKLRRNVARDEAASAELVRQGWRVIVIWECETRDRGLLSARLRALIGSRDRLLRARRGTRRRSDVKA